MNKVKYVYSIFFLGILSHCKPTGIKPIAALAPSVPEAPSGMSLQNGANKTPEARKAFFLTEAKKLQVSVKRYLDARDKNPLPESLQAIEDSTLLILDPVRVSSTNPETVAQLLEKYVPSSEEGDGLGLVDIKTLRGSIRREKKRVNFLKTMGGVNANSDAMADKYIKDSSKLIDRWRAEKAKLSRWEGVRGIEYYDVLSTLYEDEPKPNWRLETRADELREKMRNLFPYRLNTPEFADIKQTMLKHDEIRKTRPLKVDEARDFLTKLEKVFPKRELGPLDKIYSGFEQELKVLKANWAEFAKANGVEIGALNSRVRQLILPQKTDGAKVAQRVTEQRLEKARNTGPERTAGLKRLGVGTNEDLLLRRASPAAPSSMGSRKSVVGNIGAVEPRARPEKIHIRAFLTDSPEQFPEEDPYTLLIQDLDTLASELSDFQNQK